ncbi:UbiD family decarboxylase domain-containing protein [Microlunatus sp. GCM10028923]|uniref:UbiD family decarboxylase domain-containing protein n=1 Tax=Microlunatus sp. GCM10028923 TaxID=3273400 RepID=UPI003615339C
MTAAEPSLRSVLTAEDARGEVVDITEPVSAEYEIAAYLTRLDPGPIVRFGNVVGTDLKIVGNVLGSRTRIARALGTTPDGIEALIDKAIKRSDPPRIVQQAASRERDYSITLDQLPIPTFFERENGPYLTAGVIIARDPITGAGNASFARVRPLGGNRAMIGIAPNHHLNLMAQRSPDGRLEIAVVIGAHPAVQLAACLYLGLGDDELTHVAALLGRPLSVVETTNGLLVPAEAELILEATLDVRDTFVEGAVSEYHGLYENYGPAATAEFTKITGRSDAMLQVILPGWHREHAYLGALPIAAGLRNAVARSIPNVGEIAVVESGGGRLSAVVQLHRPRPGQGKQLMFACWGSLSMLKQVIIVDSDIDVWDPIQVEWAKITRCRFERDLIVVPEVRTDRSEPLEAGGVVTKLGFDALAVESDRTEGFQVAAPPAAVMEQVAKRLAGTARGFRS